MSKGIFKVKNPSKYIGNYPIIWRSAWEMKYMMELDHDPNVIEWSSESVIVPYQSPLDKRIHRYYPDFFVHKTNGKYLIEIKPFKQTIQPTQGKSKRRFITEAATYAKNLAKWNAAERYCAQRGWKFIKLTENDLGIPSKWNH